jgi:hypothetical protein
MAREAAPAREPFRKSLLLSSDMLYAPLLEKFCVYAIIKINPVPGTGSRESAKNENKF